MKSLKITLLIAVIGFSNSIFASQCISTGNGNWENASTWSCGYVPGSGDSIVIGPGDTVRVTDKHQGLQGVVLEVFGALAFDNSDRLTFDYAGSGISPSIIIFYPGAECYDGNGSSGISFGSGGSGCDIYKPNSSITPQIPGSYYDGCTHSAYLPLEKIAIEDKISGNMLSLDWSLIENGEVSHFEIYSAFDKVSQLMFNIPATGTGNYISTYHQDIDITAVDSVQLYAIIHDNSMELLRNIRITKVIQGGGVDIKMKPNPFIDKIEVFSKQSINVELISIDGVRVFEGKGKTYFNINTTDISDGIYYIIVSDDLNIIERQKLLKY